MSADMQQRVKESTEALLSRLKLIRKWTGDLNLLIPGYTSMSEEYAGCVELASKIENPEVRMTNLINLVRLWFSSYIGFIDEALVLYVGQLCTPYHEKERKGFIHSRDHEDAYYKKALVSCSTEGVRYEVRKLEKTLENIQSNKLRDKLEDLIERVGGEVDDLHGELDGLIRTINDIFWDRIKKLNVLDSECEKQYGEWVKLRLVDGAPPSLAKSLTIGRDQVPKRDRTTALSIIANIPEEFENIKIAEARKLKSATNDAANADSTTAGAGAAHENNARKAERSKRLRLQRIESDSDDDDEKAAQLQRKKQQEAEAAAKAADFSCNISVRDIYKEHNFKVDEDSQNDINPEDSSGVVGITAKGIAGGASESSAASANTLSLKEEALALCNDLLARLANKDGAAILGNQGASSASASASMGNRSDSMANTEGLCEEVVIDQSQYATRYGLPPPVIRHIKIRVPGVHSENQGSDDALEIHVETSWLGGLELFDEFAVPEKAHNLAVNDILLAVWLKCVANFASQCKASPNADHSAAQESEIILKCPLGVSIDGADSASLKTVFKDGEVVHVPRRGPLDLTVHCYEEPLVDEFLDRFHAKLRQHFTSLTAAVSAAEASGSSSSEAKHLHQMQVKELATSLFPLVRRTCSFLSSTQSISEDSGAPFKQRVHMLDLSDICVSPFRQVGSGPRGETDDVQDVQDCIASILEVAMVAARDAITSLSVPFSTPISSSSHSVRKRGCDSHLLRVDLSRNHMCGSLLACALSSCDELVLDGCTIPCAELQHATEILIKTRETANKSHSAVQDENRNSMDVSHIDTNRSSNTDTETATNSSNSNCSTCGSSGTSNLRRGMTACGMQKLSMKHCHIFTSPRSSSGTAAPLTLFPRVPSNARPPQFANTLDGLLQAAAECAASVDGSMALDVNDEVGRSSRRQRDRAAREAERARNEATRWFQFCEALLTAHTSIVSLDLSYCAASESTIRMLLLGLYWGLHQRKHSIASTEPPPPPVQNLVIKGLEQTWPVAVSAFREVTEKSDPQLVMFSDFTGMQRAI